MPAIKLTKSNTSSLRTSCPLTQNPCNAQFFLFHVYLKMPSCVIKYVIKTAIINIGKIIIHYHAIYFGLFGENLGCKKLKRTTRIKVKTKSIICNANNAKGKAIIACSKIIILVG
jgi:hypothetical protein